MIMTKTLSLKEQVEQEVQRPSKAPIRQTGRTRMAIYDFIVTFSEKNGFPPTIREIMQAVGLASPGTVSMHLRRLEADHLIERYANHARAIRVQDIL
jgi:SOS-response transcriptional repressor LexA